MHLTSVNFLDEIFFNDIKDEKINLAHTSGPFSCTVPTTLPKERKDLTNIIKTGITVLD